MHASVAVRAASFFVVEDHLEIGLQTAHVLSPLQIQLRLVFAEHFVANYCPLVWMKDTGALVPSERNPQYTPLSPDAAPAKGKKKVKSE